VASITRFFRFLFTIVTGLLFVVSFLIAIPCYFVVFSLASAKNAPRIAHRITRAWARVLFTIFLVRVKVKHRELVDENTTYVFIANHRSQLDIPSYLLACNNTYRFLAKAELTKAPLLGYVIKRLYISVDRKNKEARAKSMENMMDSLRENISVFICPEGTRNKTDQPLIDFRDGAFRLAIAAQVPLAVLTLSNADKLLSPFRPFELSPGTITCTWSKPIPTTGMTPDDIESLKSKRAL